MRHFVAALILIALGAAAASNVSSAELPTSVATFEYYDAIRDHYFISSDDAEINALNSGRFHGWAPTGFSFPVLPANENTPGTTPVCRFYGNPDAGLDSHFYSANPAECQHVQKAHSGVWLLESWNVFRAYLPDPVTGSCPAGTQAIYRLWNGRADVNHRYTDRADVARSMQRIGYTPEGYGPASLPVAFCEPAPSRVAPTCVATPDTTTPSIGSTVTLTATCSGDPIQYHWVGCTSTTNTCLTTETSIGGKSYVVTAANDVATSAPAVASVVWQPAKPGSTIACSVATDNTAPAVDAKVTLSASCTGNVTRFSWLGCNSSSNTCVATSSVPGGGIYTVVGYSGSSSSSPTTITINWQPVPIQSAGRPCTLSSSNAAPNVGSAVLLTATCSGQPTAFNWLGCSSSTNTCSATSSDSGPRTYAVTANDGPNRGATASLTVNWQPPTSSVPVSCTLDANAASALVGSSVLLTANCTGGPTAYVWSGCTSTSNTCTATSSIAGNASYSVVGSNGASSSTPAATTIAWQQVNVPAATAIACTLGVSNTAPMVGSSVTVTATCTGNPSTFVWTGCSGSTSSCSATGSVAGTAIYSVIASSGSKASIPSAIAVAWQLPTPIPAGMPTGADFVGRAGDPRGGDNAYSTFKRLPNGSGISFGGFSHDRSGNNAVAIYDPSSDAWRMPVANTPWSDGPTLPSGSMDVTGRKYLGNRDNHNVIVVGARNEFWAFTGQRGIDLQGNWRGVLNTQSWQWQINDDVNAFAPVGAGVPSWINSAAGWIDSLGVGYIFGGAEGDNPYDGLVRIETNPGGPAPFKVTQWANAWGNASFSGSEKLRYISNSHWVRNDKIHVYGGGFESHAATDANGNLQRAPNYSIYEIDVTVPSMRVLSTNNLPDGQRVQGEAIIADRDPVKDIMIATDGVRVNVYDYATQLWVNVPVNTATDADRQSPSSDGAGRQGFYSPEAGQLLILGGHGHLYGLRLNYSGSSAPSALSCTLATDNAAPVTGTSITLTANCSGGVTAYQWTGCASTTSTCTATSTTTGSYTYAVSATNASSSASASATVIWSAPPVSPPPPGVSSTGSRTFTASAIRYSGPMAVLGSSKHLDFARLGDRWYKLAGDHADTGSPLDVPIPPSGLQDGQQVVLSFNVPANDGREDTPYYLPASYGTQAANPDDAMAIVVGNEAWVMNTATNRGPLAQPTNAATQVDLLQKIMAYSPPSAQWPLGHWRVVANVPWTINGDRAWRGFFDPVKNRIIIPTTRNGAVWTIIDAGTGADLTKYDAGGVPYQYGDYIFSVAGVAPDFVNRVFYVYDLNTHALYRVSMDNPGAPTKVIDLPEPVQGTQAAIKLTWHPDLRGVVIAATKMHIYEVDSAKLSSAARPDGFVNGAGVYVPTSTIFFDPDSHDIVSIGTIDWDTGINPGVYWRIDIK